MTLGLTVATGAAGAIGALLRFAVEGAVMRALTRPFPLGTLVVNLSASLLLGVLVGATAEGTARTIVGTGLLGGYSTFSAWMLETRALAERRQGRAAVANLLVSVVGGVVGVLVGRALAGAF